MCSTMGYQRPLQVLLPPQSLRVEVRVMHAHAHVLANALTDKSDCFVRLKVTRTGETLSTPICWNRAQPHWYHSLVFTDVIINDVFQLDLCQQHNLVSPSILGSATVSVSQVLNRSISILNTWNFQAGSRMSLNAAHQRELAQDYPLSGDSGSVSLVVTDQAYVVPLSESSPEILYKQFVIHKFLNSLSKTAPLKVAKSVLSTINKTARRVHPILDLSHPLSHILRANSTFALRLSFIDHYFGARRQAWNKDYPAAKRIFGGPTSPALKAALITQHHNLYGKLSLEPTNTGVSGASSDLRNLLQASTGALLDGADLLALLNNGIRNGKSRVYTYVITDEELRFAETGAAFQKDMDSKHAMHNCAEPECVYAGEMHFRRRLPSRPNEPEFTLVVDNASGTYAPDPVDLPRVRSLLLANFHGLNIEALDFRDPLLKKYNEAVTRGTE